MYRHRYEKKLKWKKEKLLENTSGAVDNVGLVYVLIDVWNKVTSEDYLQKQWL